MITSKKLKKYKKINHGFFNRKGGKSKGIYSSLNCGPGSLDDNNKINKNLRIVSNKIGVKKNKLILMNQIHSSKFKFIKKIPKKKLKVDGIITNKRQIALGVLTADCAPIFIYDKSKQTIAALHAGWRGAIKKIVIRVLNNFIKNGSKIDDLIAVIGPCIRQNSYEVKKDFKKKFLIKDPKNIKYFRNIRKKIFFSLENYIKGQLYDFGVKNVELIKTDTFNEKNNFFSSRRSLKNNENDYGRNISIIMIK